MKMMLLCIFLFMANTTPEKPMMEEVRVLYQNAASKEMVCRELIALLEPYTTNNTLFLGYKAGATMLMAKHVFNPISKLNYFNKGRKMLEKAISTEPKNIELRMLRFQIQSNVPFFLGYNDNIGSDKKFILKSVSKITNINLKKYIISSLKGSERLGEEEIQEMKKKIKVHATSATESAAVPPR